MIMMMMMFETDATVSDIITRSPFVNAIRENITSSTKPEVHNVSPEEDQASIAGTKKFSKAQPWGFRAMRAERQTDKRTYSSQYSHPSRERSKIE